MDTDVTRRSNARRFRRALLAAIATIAAALALVQPASAAGGDARYIVVYRDSLAGVDRETGRLEHSYGFQSDHRYRYALKGFAARLSDAQLARIRRDGNVAFISPDQPVQAVGTAPLAPGDAAPTGVRRVEAATETTTHQASNVNVAVIDTGIDLTHPDLNAVSGKNCLTKRKNATAQDDNGHGTHVAGTIAARNNGSGVVGVAPGTRLYAVKVLDRSGSGTWSQVVCGIDWVTQNTASLNIKAVNMSLGGFGFADGDCGALIGDALNKAICQSTAAGVTYVVAAGNSASEFSTTVPAAYPEVLTVTAMSDSDGQPGALGGAPACRTVESDDSYATFSNFADPSDSGGIAHMVAGPGVCILSTWLGGGYRTASGTSMATPHVTGTVALCMGNGGAPGPCSGLAPADVVAKVRADAEAHATVANGFVGDPANPVPDQYFGPLVWDGAY
jgi:subtilisin